MIFSFSIPGQPKGKARPHVTSRGTYTPEKTVEYEDAVRAAFHHKYAYVDAIPAGTPINISIMAYYPIPQSASKVKKARMLSGEIRPTVKPDADNVIKIICDALNPNAQFYGAWRDDAQVADAHFGKWYSDTPRVDVYISEIQTKKGDES
jgi:Holliday junction resolvase RusA-like endonuclease